MRRWHPDSSGVNALLAEIDRLAGNSNFLCLATSNFEQAIDSALRSRANMEVRLDLPSYEARLEILSHTQAAFSGAGAEIGLRNRDIAAIAKRTSGLSARSLRKLFLQVLSSAHKPYGELGLNDFLQTINQGRDIENGGKQRWSK